MKKILAFIITMLLAILFSGCVSQSEADGTAEAFVPTGELSAQNVIIDIANDNNGYYELMADVTVSFDDDGMITWVAAEDAVVLAFQVSDYYEGGVYVYSGTEMDELLSALKAIAENADSNDAEDLQDIIERLENGGPIEGAST
uniref:Uncharacterized protein n=1 Tax=Dulem virus 37 TaxID=3145755 RepID=A0AAU8AXS5_9CAUD